MPAQNKFQNEERNQRFLHRAIVGLICAFFFMAWSVWRLPQQITVYHPPDISQGYVDKVGDVPLATIYGFARTLWETINYCDKDCGEEYPKQLEKYRAYLTRSCYEDLYEHYRTHRSLFSFRSRLLLPTDNAMFSTDRVRKREGAYEWGVKLEYELGDVVNGTETRISTMEYPLKIVKSGRPRDVNPHGLEVDCYFNDGPVVIVPEQKEKKEEDR